MKCKRCGFDFPNIEYFKKGCSHCETPDEMYKREMDKLRCLMSDEIGEDISKYIITVNEKCTAFYEVFGKNKKEAEKYFFDNLARLSQQPLGFQKEIENVVCIEKAKDKKPF
jgi:uncharacterized protein (DUF608 family)